MADNSATQVKIIVIGSNGSGKSSLVDKLCRGENRAPVVKEEAPTAKSAGASATTIQQRVRAESKLGRLLKRKKADQHTKDAKDKSTAKVLRNECMIGNESVIIFDSQVGIDDPEVVSVAKTCNVVLVCQKLYEGVYINNFLEALGSEVLKRTIFVFTFGDEYIKILYQNLEKKMAEAKALLVRKEKRVMEDINEILKENGIEEEIADGIPSMIASAVEDSLPTTNGDSWVDELWELCKQRRVMKLPKMNAKILVVGHTRIGKSSFINKIVGQKVTEVQDGVLPCEHDGHLIVSIECTARGVPVMIYDSRGFSDPSIKDRNITDTAISTIQTADVILICHKLYGTLDKSAIQMLNDLAKILGNELMKHTIFVFTRGDDYKTNCDDDEDKKEHMEKQENHFKEELRKVLCSCNIEKDIVDGIPSIITSGKHISLPTSDNWVDDFWSLCEERCTPEAVPLVSGIRRNIKKTVAGTGATSGAMGGLIVGAAGGALIGTGTIPIPGAGTALGAAVGAIGGMIVGGALAGGGGVAVVTGAVVVTRALHFVNKKKQKHCAKLN